MSQANTTSNKSCWFWAYATFNCGIVALFCVYEFILRVLPAGMNHPLMRDFHTQAEGIGLMSSAFFVAYAIMQIPVGVLFDCFSARFLITMAMSVCAVGLGVFSAAPELWIAIASRVLMGAGAAFAVVGTFILIGRWFPKEYFPLGTGLVQFMCAAGAIVGQWPISRLVVLGFQWRIISWVIVGVGLILALLYFMSVRDYPDSDQSEVTYQSPKLRKLLRILGIILSNKRNWLVAGYACFTWAPISLLSALWGAPFIEALYPSVSSSDASFAVAFSWAGVATGSPIIGWLTKLFNRTFIFLILCPLLSLIVVTLFLYIPGIPFEGTYVLLFLFGFAAGALPLSFDLIKSNNSPKVVGTAIGFNNMAVVAGGSVFQFLIGAFLHWHWAGHLDGKVPIYTVASYDLALTILPISSILCILLAWLLKRNQAVTQ